MVAAIGITIGAGVSLALGRYVRTLLFQVSATDAISLAAAAALMLAVALLPASCPPAAPPPSTQPWRCGGLRAGHSMGTRQASATASRGDSRRLSVPGDCPG